MFRSKHLSVLLAVVAFTFVLIAIARPSVADQKQTVYFRLTQWKAQHIHDLQKAEERYKTLKGLGCEVKKYAHNGHMDVKYRQLKWAGLSLAGEDEARQWQRWLRAMGFEVRQIQ